MAKYIDVERLEAEIERRRLSNRYIDTEGYENELLEITTSLQQEQPLFSDNLDEAAEEYSLPKEEPIIPYTKADIKQAFNAGAKWMAEKAKQEQPEVDLDKFAEKIDNYKARYKYPESVSVKGAMAFMARMFYQYPNVARDWYENLPKVTMDDNARKEE